jgi:Cd2+/Zn2+-exporting ATPase
MNPTSLITELYITGMDCADCAKTLERGVGQLEGVQSCQVNFMNGTMHIQGSPDLNSVVSRIEALGYGVRPESQSPQPIPDYQGISGFFRFMWGRRETRLVLLGGLGLLFAFLLTAWEGTGWLVHGIELAIIVVIGSPIMLRGIRQAIYSRDITINLLMSLATIGAVLIGEWNEAATVIVLFAIGEALEGYSADRARGALHSLMLLAPQEALVLRPCMDCAEHLGKEGYTGGPCPWCGEHQQAIPVAEVQLGETILIRPGERVPLDGVVSEGESSIDQSPITGESIPAAKIAGDKVFAGSINGGGVLQVHVTSLAQDSTLSRIIRMVETAQAQKAPSERFVDRFAKVYTPAVIALAGLMAVVPPLLLDGVFDTWLYRALALLVVACPCALVISTPVTVVSAMVRAAQHGILIKGGVYLEALGRVRVFAFDKTGTLTNGTPQVIIVRSVDCQTDTFTPCEPCNHMLSLAGAVERQSEHPLGRAIVDKATQWGVLNRQPLAQRVRSLAGRGVQGQINHQLVTVGSHLFFDEYYPHTARLCQEVQTHEAQGQTVMLVAEQEQVLGFITVADTLRPAAKDTIRGLHGSHTIMLTGDNPTVARAIADEAGIDDVRAGLLPDGKAAVVQALVQEHGSVAMVGDGVNDAPALAAATVGIAMGGAGTAQAMETADVVLMQDDLSQLPHAVQISRRAAQIIHQNIALSIIIKAIFVVLTLFGHTTLWMAVFADMGMSLLVTFNGMRLLGYPHWDEMSLETK